jgi:Fe-S cluster biogenesis protein NfuA
MNKKIVEIYAESTPNPAALKFVTSLMLLPQGQVEYRSQQEAACCPLAAGLLAFSGVKSVFIASNFITLTRENQTDWYEVMPIFREFIKSYLESDEPVFTANPFQKFGTDSDAITAEASDETAQQIISILEEYVRPAVEQDGGYIRFISFEQGVVKVLLQGSCSGCPSSQLTLKTGIENLLRQMVPAVREVIAVEESSV